MTRPNVRIVVERVVLDGVDVPPAQVDQLVAAMGEELRRLALGTWAGWAGGTARTAAPTVRAPAVDLVSCAAPAEIGRVLGGAVHGALAPGKAAP